METQRTPQEAGFRTKNTMNVTINEDLCVGCGLCAELCPDLFWMEDDFAKVRDSGPLSETMEKKCIQTAMECPTTAIQIKP